MTTLSTEQIVAELKWNELAIKEVTGYSPRFFRPVSFLFFFPNPINVFFRNNKNIGVRCINSDDVKGVLSVEQK